MTHPEELGGGAPEPPLLCGESRGVRSFSGSVSGLTALQAPLLPPLSSSSPAGPPQAHLLPPPCYRPPGAHLLAPPSGSSPAAPLWLTAGLPSLWGLLYFLLPCLESLPASLSSGFSLIFKNFHLNITPLESSPSSEFPYVLVKMGQAILHLWISSKSPWLNKMKIYFLFLSQSSSSGLQLLLTPLRVWGWARKGFQAGTLWPSPSWPDPALGPTLPERWLGKQSSFIGIISVKPHSRPLR